MCTCVCVYINFPWKCVEFYFGKQVSYLWISSIISVLMFKLHLGESGVAFTLGPI